MDDLENDSSSDCEDATWIPEQTDREYNEMKDDDDSKHNSNPRLDYKNKNIREEPKGIVFLSKLLLLFQHCHFCFSSNPETSVSQTGTLLTIESKCQYCKKESIWKSQPYLLGKFPAGNILLSFAILSAGASLKKVLLVFRHMGVLAYHRPAYYYHQRHLLIPAIIAFWRSYKARIIQSLSGKEVALAGDGRHDSMGHSAKYGTYTIFCCTVGLIIEIVLVQANEAGSSSAMEFLGHQKAFAFLLTTGMIIKTFVSDRHSGIAKWMREECPKKCKALGKPVIDHFFDLWHIAKKIQKVLTKLSKEKGCEKIGKWTKTCVKHFFWSVISTPPKMGLVVLAKFHSFLPHVLNQHKDLPNKLFNKCAHKEVIKQRLWLTKGSEAYEKLCDALQNTFLVKGIKQASPEVQTSCLEGYHSVINHFAPKMLAYSYLGMLSRTIPAALHFNYNLRQETKIGDDGNPKLRLVYPKFKYGEATVREVKAEPCYEYVGELYDTLISTSREELQNIEEEMQDKVPEPLHSMLEKEEKSEAIRKYKVRKEKLKTPFCPPTCTDAELQVILQGNTKTGNNTTRKPPTCTKCGNPRKGHKRGQCNIEQNS